MTQIEQIKAEIERRMYENQQDYSEEGAGAFYEDRQLLSFINSLPAEPSKDLKEAAEEYSGKSAHPLNNAFIAGAQWQKERDINKACEWLNKNVVEYHPRTGKLRPIVNINAFREAMEGEK